MVIWLWIYSKKENPSPRRMSLSNGLQSVHYYSASFSFTGFYKQWQTNATTVKPFRKNRNRIFFIYSLKSLYLFLHILYITGVVRHTGRTKRIHKQLRQSTVLNYAHRLFKSIPVLRAHFQKWDFHTSTQE